MNQWVRLRIPATVCAVMLLIMTVATLLLAAPATKRAVIDFKRLVSEKQEGNYRLTTFSTAKVTHEDAVFTADTIVMRSQENVHEFTCTGNPVFTDPENRITGDKVIAYSTPRRAEFHDNVKMVSTPKKKTGNGDVRNKLNNESSTTTCDKLSYDYANKTAEATGNVVVKQTNRTVWADKGFYYQDKELLVLKGNVRMKNTGEEEIKDLKDAETVTVSLETDWVDIVAPENGFVTMTLDVKDDEQKPETGTKK